MTREIKFRRWDEKWGMEYEPIFFPKLLSINEHLSQESRPIMQFTGLYDSTKWEELTEEERTQWTRNSNMPSEWKGKEIYESDLLEQYNCIYEVKFGDYYNGKSFEDAISGNGWYIERRKGSSFTYLEELRDGKEYKIIGNIHDNPELLMEDDV